MLESAARLDASTITALEPREKFQEILDDIRCIVPDDCLHFRRYPFMLAREVMREVVAGLRKGNRSKIGLGESSAGGAKRVKGGLGRT